MKSINKTIIIGNVVDQPTTTQLNANTEVSKFTIAINESYKKTDGTLVESTTYIDCEAWMGLAKVVANYVKKGSRIYIEGALKADSWTDADSGKTRTKHKIKVVDLLLLDPKPTTNNNSGYSAPAKPQPKQTPEPTFMGDDDDLGF